MQMPRPRRSHLWANGHYLLSNPYGKTRVEGSNAKELGMSLACYLYSSHIHTLGHEGRHYDREHLLKKVKKASKVLSK